MPGRDGKGPDGKGQMTGRQAGYCNDTEHKQEALPAYGRGCGYGNRNGRRNKGSRRSFAGMGRRFCVLSTERTEM